MTHKCVSKWTIIGSDNGLSPARCQAIIWTNAAILLINSWEQTSENVTRNFYILFIENAFQNVVRKNIVASHFHHRAIITWTY